MHGVDLLTLDSESRRQIRGRKVSFVAQSAAAAFNPALSIDEQVTEGLRIHHLMPRAKALIARETSTASSGFLIRTDRRPVSAPG
jgi:ABC-type dipeptide/oligopeptide/nickel transport system ATPase component